MEKDTDVLMITYNRPHYLRRTLPELLENSGPSTRIWVWQNGDDPETTKVVRQYSNEIFQFHHSQQNVGLREPTNWLWQNAKGKFIAKVDDDCIVPVSWDTRLREAHISEPRFGVIGCWHFAEEDFIPEIAQTKIQSFSDRYQLLVNFWVGGSGYLMKKECVDKLGRLQDKQSFTDYCIQIGRAGWVNGWLYPLVLQEHLDDPRASGSGLRTNQDFEKFEPLSAKRTGAQGVNAWLAHIERSARYVQEAPIDPGYWSPTRQRLRIVLKRLGIIIGR